MDMTIAGSSGSLEGQIGLIETMLQSTTDAAADLGAIQSRLERQTAFTNDLMDSLDKGIGTLVDADMNESSTRLKALQTQQQLSIQALSIANASSQSLMQLFQ
jgi:flagellin